MVCSVSKRETEPRLSFFVYFVLQYLYLTDEIKCFCCIRFSFFSSKPRDWLGRTSIRCQVGP